MLTKTIWFGDSIKNLTRNILKKDTEIVTLTANIIIERGGKNRPAERMSFRLFAVICRLIANGESDVFNHIEYV